MVDLDYFWGYSLNKKIQILSNDFVQESGSGIGSNLANINVLTIALSPSCCGGWDKTLECSKIFLRNMTFVELCIECLREKRLFPHNCFKKNPHIPQVCPLFQIGVVKCNHLIALD